MRPVLVLLQSHCLLSMFAGVCVPVVVGSLPPALPWHVSCPVRCVCQIKPWFSPDSVYHEAPTVDCNDLLLTKLPLPIPPDTHTLRLQSNLLSALDTAVLHGLPNLTDLDLSQNRFSHVRTITQSYSIPSLLSLHLEENHLGHLPEDSFSTLPALQELFLSHNNLRSIAPGAFNGLNTFALHQHIMFSLPSLQEVSLHSNPLRCDCLFHWAAKETLHPHFEKDTQTDGKNATLCSEPPELRARRVREVSSGEMSTSCLPMIPANSLPSYVKVREGGKLALHCRALADPQPELYWVTPSGVKRKCVFGLCNSK
uniref:Leucine rich repeat neuronal 2 n=1 Tax=Salarias fasciatus TaxID=181472 RepID=A0A672IF85_SALFA